MECTVHFIITLFNVGNVLLCVIYQLNVTVFMFVTRISWAGYLSKYSDWLRAGRSGDRIPMEARFSAPVQTGSGAHSASYTMGTGSFQGVESGRGVTLTRHPF
jgi:hypothetical protein